MIDIDKYIEAVQIKWVKKLAFLSITLTSLTVN